MHGCLLVCSQGVPLSCTSSPWVCWRRTEGQALVREPAAKGADGGEALGSQPCRQGGHSACCVG